MSQDLLAALRKPSLYPGRPRRVLTRETHISWVFIAGDRAYKLKKPLALPFLDYSTPQRRWRMCQEEVRLNRRLAPDIYMGVKAVIATAHGFELAEEDDPRALEHLVEMRRFDERRTLAATVHRGELSDGEICAVGETLADFHRRSPRVRFDGVPCLALQRRLSENVNELQALVEQRAELDALLALQRFTQAFLHAHGAMIDARAWHGFTREVHGDLRAEHVLLEEQVQVIDCVEFDERARRLDVGEDLAFLVMDLTALGDARAAAKLLHAYRRAGGDPGEDRLLAFYALQRALVRAKVELIAASQHTPASTEHGHCSARARDLLTLAQRFAWRARLPLAIAVCGLPAAGKSELAGALASASGLSHLSSDLTRKRLAGIDPSRHGDSELYGERFSELTYAELGARAAAQVSERGGVLIDATFRRHRDRKAFVERFGHAAPLLFIECRAPVGVLLARAAARERRTADAAAPSGASDASRQIVLEQAESWEPLDEIDAQAHLTLRSDRPAEQVLEDALALLDRRLRLRSETARPPRVRPPR